MSRNFIPTLLLSIVLLSLASCTSTDIVEQDLEQCDNTFSLKIVTPEVYGFGSPTRAHNQHKLRLKACLYSSSAPSTLIETTEEISNSQETIIQFSIKNTGDYFVTVFADYIDEGASPNDKGHYPDKYYDTTIPGKVTVLTGNANFFNNDDRDCFAGKAVFTKGLNAEPKSLTLRRPVCKIQVAAPNNNVGSLVKQLELTECSHFESYSFALDGSEKTGTLAEGSSTPKSLTLANENAIISSPTDDNLFFFYTFGGEDTDTSRPALGNITFNLTPADNVTLDNSSRTIQGGLVQPAPNYRVTVRGGANWISAKPGGDDITVNFVGFDNWKTESKDI